LNNTLSLLNQQLECALKNIRWANEKLIPHLDMKHSLSHIEDEIVELIKTANEFTKARIPGIWELEKQEWREVKAQWKREDEEKKKKQNV
jgi:hypothetical protein